MHLIDHCVDISCFTESGLYFNKFFVFESPLIILHLPNSYKFLTNWKILRDINYFLIPKHGAVNKCSDNIVQKFSL